MQRVRLPLENQRVVGALLRKIRTDAGITQSAVAERARISEHWYRLVERHDRQPSLPVARDIATALGCSLHDFCVPTDTQVAA